MANHRVGLYIHIPFCRFKCTYCDFNAYAGMRSLYEPYSLAVKSQISNFRSHIANPGCVPSFRSPPSELKAETIYFGGGTPSLLPLPFLAKILSACRESLRV